VIPVIVNDKPESFALVHEHFGERVSAIGLFVSGNPLTYGPILELYRHFTSNRNITCSIYEYGEIGLLKEIRETSSVDSGFVKWLRAQPKPLGLFTLTTHIGLFLWHCCRLAGLRVPEDVMLIGIDDFDVANESDPPVTSLRLALEAKGTRAVELACESLAGGTLPKLVTVPGASIVGRRSTLAVNSKEWDLDATLAFIEKHACEGINVDDVRMYTQSMTRESFQRRFVASVGITPRRALEARRMREARRLLAETEMSPSWIAGMCGYPDYTHFFKLFRKLNGVSPTVFRHAAV
jgi:LacI family transcriptional regulator